MEKNDIPVAAFEQMARRGIGSVEIVDRDVRDFAVAGGGLQRDEIPAAAFECVDLLVGKLLCENESVVVGEIDVLSPEPVL